jgi:hypothetical protein
MEGIMIQVKHPMVPEAKKLTKDDVFGHYDEKLMKRTSEGMVVCCGYLDAKTLHPKKTRCPIFKDFIPYKSVTVVCKAEQEQEVIYWLEYVHGGNSVSGRKELKDGRIALRSDYQCW